MQILHKNSGPINYKLKNAWYEKNVDDDRGDLFNRFYCL